ncbi:MAG: PQQ-dependent sugar dehydrogenase [Vicinamibacterales bacterium]
MLTRLQAGAAASALMLACLLAVSSYTCDGSRMLQQPPGDGQGPSDTYTASDGTRFGVQTVASNLEVPWAIAFAPDGRMFVTERPGRVRIVENGQLVSEPALVLDDVFAQGEAGLLGLTLHPDFGATRLVYLVYTARDGGRIANRVVRYREAGGRLGEQVVLLDGLDAASIHDGARIKFGPDGLLYVTMGDAASPSVAQDLASLNGKVLRLDPDGTTPRDNPFSSPVFSYGHRNPQGIDWDPATGLLWETEHGQTANDEVNLIVAGGNYGWPLIQADETAPGMIAPVIHFPGRSVAPSGAAFYRGTRIPAFTGNLFFATLSGRHLHRAVLQSGRRRIASHERLMEDRYGRLREVVSGPDGYLYFTTSNRDGRGAPAPEDDRIFRIVPAQQGRRNED